VEEQCPLKHPWAWTFVTVLALLAIAGLIGRSAAERRRLRGLEAEFAEIAEA
jgi:hypothetical protein